MPHFPRKEPDVIVLADAMLAGYGANPTIFPSADTAVLNAALDAYIAARHTQQAKMSLAQQATEAKEGRLDDLEKVMANQLKLSEVDCAADPRKLTLIGWGPKQAPSANPAPGQVRELEAIKQGPSSVFLDWKPPLRTDGGTVRFYLIERRDQPAGGGEPGPWAQLTTALETEITVVDQPRGIQMEYHIIAINNAGQSTPSNIAAVVL